jgi:hypothetical protein
MANPLKFPNHDQAFAGCAASFARMRICAADIRRLQRSSLLLVQESRASLALADLALERSEIRPQGGGSIGDRRWVRRRARRATGTHLAVSRR